MNTLNKEQKKAVETVEGPVRIVAGPGSGKTRTIIQKIAYVIEQKLAKPHEILAITFTNKASNEMKERASKIINDKKPPVIFTFHAFSAFFLRVEGNNIDIGRNYEILDTSDQKRIFRELFKKRKTVKQELSIGEVFELIKFYRNSESTLTNHISEKEGLNYEKSMFFQDYIEYKKNANALDFDDLIIKVSQVLKEYPEIADHWKSKYKYIFVDEFQDTDDNQYSIIKSITNKNSNITIVGDPDQNIYSWRGANLNLFMNLSNDYPTVQDINLIQNYRSTQEIVKIAQNLIKENKKRFQVVQEAANEKGKRPSLYEAESDQAEAVWISGKIQELITSGVKPEEIAVVYRVNSQSGPIEYSLGARDIDYKMIGGFRIYDRKSIKQVSQFLKFIARKDDYSLEQIINVPARGMGPISLQKLKKASFDKFQSMYDFLINNDLSSSPLRKFVHETQKAINRIESSKDKISVFRKYLENLGFFNLYSNESTRIQEINEFINQLETFVNESKLFFEDAVLEFLQKTSLLSSSDNDSELGKVTLMTGHSSKGLEFEYVFVPGVKEGILPHFMNENTEEERRLFYVMVTRAKKELYISYFLSETFLSKGSLPSRFINEAKLMLSEYSKIDKYNNIVEVSVPDGYENTKKAERGDLAFHLEFGSGVVIKIDDEIVTIAFNKVIGVKDLLLGHKSLFIRK